MTPVKVVVVNEGAPAVSAKLCYITEHPKWAADNGWSLSAIRRVG